MDRIAQLPLGRIDYAPVVMSRALFLAGKDCAATQPSLVPPGQLLTVDLVIRAGLVESVAVQSSSDRQNWITRGEESGLSLGVGSHFLQILDALGNPIVISMPYLRVVFCPLIPDEDAAADDAEIACICRITAP